MLNKENRISSQEFKDLKSGVTLRTPLFNVKKYPSNQNKIAIIIAKKYIKNSSARNLIRRRVYSAYNKIIKDQKNIGTLAIYYMYKSPEQELPEYSIIEKQIKNICGIQ